MTLDSPFKLGDHVVYQGKTYRFPGEVCAVTDDGQIVVRAFGAPNGDYAGMKHIFGPAQLVHRPMEATLRAIKETPQGNPRRSACAAGQESRLLVQGRHSLPCRCAARTGEPSDL